MLDLDEPTMVSIRDRGKSGVEASKHYLQFDEPTIVSLRDRGKSEMKYWE